MAHPKITIQVAPEMAIRAVKCARAFIADHAANHDTGKHPRQKCVGFFNPEDKGMPVLWVYGHPGHVRVRQND
jgi:hypothetical protein